MSHDLLWRQDLQISNSLAPNTVLLSGKVVDAEDGAPVEDATVTIEPIALRVPVGPGGTFEVPVEWREDLTLVVTSQKYATLRYAIESEEGRMIQLPSNALMLHAAEEQRTRRGAAIISKAEIEEAESSTAADAVRRIHPDWLRGTRGTVRFSGDAPIVVYVNSARWGGIDVLESISAQNISEIRFYEPRDATTRFGTGHSGGVIQIILNQ